MRRRLEWVWILVGKSEGFRGIVCRFQVDPGIDSWKRSAWCAEEDMKSEFHCARGSIVLKEFRLVLSRNLRSLEFKFKFIASRSLAIATRRRLDHDRKNFFFPKKTIERKFLNVPLSCSHN